MQDDFREWTDWNHNLLKYLFISGCSLICFSCSGFCGDAIYFSLNYLKSVMVIVVSACATTGGGPGGVDNPVCFHRPPVHRHNQHTRWLQRSHGFHDMSLSCYLGFSVHYRPPQMPWPFGAYFTVDLSLRT